MLIHMRPGYTRSRPRSRCSHLSVHFLSHRSSSLTLPQPLHWQITNTFPNENPPERDHNHGGTTIAHSRHSPCASPVTRTLRPGNWHKHTLNELSDRPNGHGQQRRSMTHPFGKLPSGDTGADWLTSPPC